MKNSPFSGKFHQRETGGVIFMLIFLHLVKLSPKNSLKLLFYKLPERRRYHIIQIMWHFLMDVTT